MNAKPVCVHGPIRLLLAVGVASVVLAPFASSGALFETDNEPLSDEQVRVLAERAISNQHRNDRALDEYERVEHRLVRTGDTPPRTLEHKVFRVVPTGTGTLKLLLKDADKPVTTELYRQQLQTWEQVLEVALRANDPRQRESVAKWKKRTNDRIVLVDATLRAYQATWLGRESWSGRPLVKLHLEPNPGFHPASRSEEILLHARATIWIDEQAAQLVKVDAEIIHDISIGGGVLGKVYRGGRFQFEQAEASPGIWLPVRYQYDFSGRKFLFGFEVHQLTEVSRYRHLGTPDEILPLVKEELAAGRTFSADP